MHAGLKAGEIGAAAELFHALQDATEDELQEGARRFINDPANIRFDESSLTRAERAMKQHWPCAARF